MFETNEHIVKIKIEIDLPDNISLELSDNHEEYGKEDIMKIHMLCSFWRKKSTFHDHIRIHNFWTSYILAAIL